MNPYHPPLARARHRQGFKHRTVHEHPVSAAYPPQHPRVVMHRHTPQLVLAVVFPDGLFHPLHKPALGAGAPFLEEGGGDAVVVVVEDVVGGAEGDVTPFSLPVPVQLGSGAGPEGTGAGQEAGPPHLHQVAGHVGQRCGQVCHAVHLKGEGGAWLRLGWVRVNCRRVKIGIVCLKTWSVSLLRAFVF